MRRVPTRATDRPIDVIDVARWDYQVFLKMNIVREGILSAVGLDRTKAGMGDACRQGAAGRIYVIIAATSCTTSISKPA